MSWGQTAIMILRELVGDSSATSEFSDIRLEEVLFASYYLTNYEGDFGYTIDITTQSFTETPTSDFITLSIYKAAALLTCGEYRQSAKNALSIKDGPSSIDLKGVAENKKELCNQFSQQYEDALTAKRSGDSSAYYAIIGPYNYEGASYGRAIRDPRSY